jgi:Secreted and surface protein containing fasciclin-like repeats
MKTIVAAAAFTALGSTFALANPTVGGAPMLESMNIVENAVNSPIHTTLVAAVQAAGLVDTLQGEGPFTVLAPTDEAFAMLPAGTVEDLLKPENLQTLQTILTCHVIPARALWGDINGMISADGGSHTITTVGGCEFTATNVNGVITIEDGQGNMAHVTTADVIQSNGVIHVIDHVLLPAM